MDRLIWVIRAWLCEVLIGWSNKMKPRGYVPSTVQATIEMVRAERAKARRG